MVSDNAVIGALIFVILILGANVIMYGIARRMARGGDVRWISALKQGLTKPLESERNKSMEELRQKVKEMEKNSKKEE